MGEIAEMMLDGTLDEETGEFIDGDSPGWPRNMRTGKGFYDGHAPDPEDTVSVPRSCKVVCPRCGHRVKAAGIYNHLHDKHGE